jgi:hypothetical protein
MVIDQFQKSKSSGGFTLLFPDKDGRGIDLSTLMLRVPQNKRKLIYAITV